MHVRHSKAGCLSQDTKVRYYADDSPHTHTTHTDGYTHHSRTYTSAQAQQEAMLSEHDRHDTHEKHAGNNVHEARHLTVLARHVQHARQNRHVRHVGLPVYDV